MTYQNNNYSHRLPPRNEMSFAYVDINLHNSTKNSEFIDNSVKCDLPTVVIDYETIAVSFETKVKRAVQYWLDKSTIHIFPRWALFVFVLFVFFLRIYLIQGYFIVAYGLGIFLLNNFIAFLSPLEDPNDDGPGLPSSAKEGKEFRPFARRLPEFKFWMACTRGAATSLVMTFFSVFDVPVFWPILLMYFGVFFFMTMKRQIAHMYKHKYVPVSFGKHKYKDAGVEHGEFGGGMAGSIGGTARRR
mmetsp:Transcript_28346/g.59224  ORF Transcript_28346/g.59224 Transcript_28346/m.59224 type:complete len:245 (+) Transcript_28346:53-787(+)